MTTRDVNEANGTEATEGEYWRDNYETMLILEGYTSDLSNPSAVVLAMMNEDEHYDINQWDDGTVERLSFMRDEWYLQLEVLGTNVRVQLEIDPNSKLSVVEILAHHNIQVHHLGPTLGRWNVGEVEFMVWYHDTPWEDPNYQVTTNQELIDNITPKDAATIILFDGAILRAVFECLGETYMPSNDQFLQQLGLESRRALVGLTQDQLSVFNEHVNKITGLQRQLVDAAADLTGWLSSIE